jgi:anaerobic magnesium-protoporphyrin IX monomethyl ester cyclase
MFDPRSIEVFVDEALSHGPRMIGITSMTCQFPDAVRLSKLLRKRTEAKILMGGTHVTVMPEQGLEVADCVVKGEGERVMLDILSGKKEAVGIINGESLDKLDEIPFPDADLLRKLTVNKEKASIITARGCPYECLFCLSREQRCLKLRFHSVPSVADYIELIHKSFGTRKFFIMDDIFTLHKRRVFEFCDEIHKRDLKLEFQCFTHPHHADLEMFKQMKKAGFLGIALGAESGNDRILNLIKKKITVLEIKECVRLLKKARLVPGVLFMMGNIGENEESIVDSIKLAKLFKCPTHFSLAQPLPGTEFLRVAKQYGKLVHTDYSKYTNRDMTFVPNDLTEERLKELYEYAQKVTKYETVRTYLGSRFPTLRKAYRKAKELVGQVIPE